MRPVREKIRNAHLYILGKGAEEKNLKALAHRLDLDRCVTFLPGTVPNHEMPALYAECDIYVQPSIIEPYGIAVLEAMACGKPVVGTDVGGMRDTLHPEESGLLVSPADSSQLAASILALSDVELRKRLGLTGRKRAVELFDIKYIASKYLDELEKLEIP
ncbi:MAG TPA: glycosyltransferase family 4 protein [Candidatus Methanoperedenaceae archaeon]|nr:glycosyltransferase family 4 protein [Candidatus Methanoperedenaceae archaeon]